jgi:hypothetical protein
MVEADEPDFLLAQFLKRIRRSPSGLKTFQKLKISKCPSDGV